MTTRSPSTRSRRARMALYTLMPAAAIGIPTLLPGCDTMATVAPQPRVMLTGQAIDDATIAQLETGRRIYLVQCTACHLAEPIDHYSMSDWNQVIPEMAQEAKLTAKEREDLAAYITTMHQAMTQSKSATTG